MGASAFSPVPKGYVVQHDQDEVPCGNLVGSEPDNSGICQHPTVFTMKTIGSEWGVVAKALGPCMHYFPI